MKKEYIIITIISLLFVLSTSISTSYAVTSYLYNSSDVSYDNSSSGTSASNVQTAVDELYAEATDYTALREQIYPVGSIYMSTSDSTVSAVQSRFGGTWVAFGSGKTIVGVNTSETEFNTVEKTGGEKTHTLTIAEMPKHRHTIIRQQWYMADKVHVSSAGSIYSWKSGTGTGGSTLSSYKTSTTNLGADAHDMLTTGGGGAHNNLPPYITVYIYKRTA